MLSHDRISVAYIPLDLLTPHLKKDELIHNPGIACHEEGCVGIATGGKRYCVEHIDKVPYVAKLMKELIASELEVQQASKHNKWRHIDPRGKQAKDILVWIGFGGRGESFQVLFGLTPNAITNYIKALRAAKLIKIRRKNALHMRLLFTDDGASLVGYNLRMGQPEDAIITILPLRS